MEICRICFEGGKLIAPCDCKGSLKFIHEKCLEQWKNKSQKIHCEICHRMYSTIPSSLIIMSMLLSWANYLTWYIWIQILSEYLFSFMGFWASLLPGVAFLFLRHSSAKVLSVTVLSIILVQRYSYLSFALVMTGNIVLLRGIRKKTKRLSPKLLVLLMELNRHEND